MPEIILPMSIDICSIYILPLLWCHDDGDDCVCAHLQELAWRESSEIGDISLVSLEHLPLFCVLTFWALCLWEVPSWGGLCWCCDSCCCFWGSLCFEGKNFTHCYFWLFVYERFSPLFIQTNLFSLVLLHTYFKMKKEQNWKMKFFSERTILVYFFFTFANLIIVASSCFCSTITHFPFLFLL